MFFLFGGFLIYYDMENKKSVLLYCDIIHTVEKLNDETAGILFKHYLRYVNDLNPQTDNILVDLVFEPIKQNLKRDLKKWGKTIDEKSKSGILGNLKRWHLEIYNKVISNEITLEEGIILSQNIAEHRTPIKNIANIAVNDNVNVKDKDIIINNIVDRKLKFSTTLKPFLDIYGKEILNDFYGYWTEPNKSNTKFRQELEKTWDVSRRLENWIKNDFSKKEKGFIKPEDKPRSNQKVS